MSDVTSVLFVGVGGQGTILASKILTIGLIEHGSVAYTHLTLPPNSLE